MAEQSRSRRTVPWFPLSLMLSATVAAAGFVLADPQKKGPAGGQPGAMPAGSQSGKANVAKPAGDTATLASTEAVVARVNKDEIAYMELAEECIARRGNEVLETMISKQLVVQACNESGIKISAKEIDDEIGRTAERLKMNREQYLRVLEKERGISEKRYVDDIVWPGLALRKLAKPLVRVSETDIQNSFEAHYGEKMKCRWIVCKGAATANQVWNDLQATDKDGDGKIELKEFEYHVTRSSTDEGSRSLGGQIQPIPRHTGAEFQSIEDAAFALRADGEISPVTRYGELWVILYREAHVEPYDVKLEAVRLQLEDEIYDAKMSDQMRSVFLELQNKASIERYLESEASGAANKSAKDAGKTARTDGDAAQKTTPKKAAKPTPADVAGEPIAARVNGEVITFKALAKEVIARKGPEVLETMITKRLIRQASQKKNITVTAQEIDDEINKNAQKLRMSRQDYAKLVKKETEADLDTFAQNTIWATIAMRKLAAPSVKVTEEDVRRGFEATFGDKMKCRWITFNDLKSATDVWNKLRDSAADGGAIQLAEFERQVSRWSTDVSTRALGGQLQPICRHTSPTFQALEQAAFAMKEDGEISKVIQVLDTYAILYREAHLPPSDAKLEEVREELTNKLREAKLAEEMARIFRDIQRSSTIENLLTGEFTAPAKDTSAVKTTGTTKNEPAKLTTTKDAAKKPQQPVRK